MRFWPTSRRSEGIAMAMVMTRQHKEIGKARIIAEINEVLALVQALQGIAMAMVMTRHNKA